MPTRPGAAVTLSKPDNPSVYVANEPEPTSRADLLKYWINLSLDDKTANKMLWISEGGAKVSRRTEEVCPVLDRPERYEYSPQLLTPLVIFTKGNSCGAQVLCKESIWNRRVYWEVEYSGWVVVGASYEGAGRRARSGPSGLGENQESWGLCWGGTCYQVWYDGVSKDIQGPTFSSTIGVLIDQPAGLICFYAMSGDAGLREVTLLHRIVGPLTDKILPGFWIGIQSSATILKKTGA